MRLTSEDVISKLSFEELSQRYSKFETIETNDRQYLMKRLKKFERTRHLSLWHDHCCSFQGVHRSFQGVHLSHSQCHI